MYAVYLCGPTDCFLAAMFMHHRDAYEWATVNNKNPEGSKIVFWRGPGDIDHSDTGWVKCDGY